MTETTPCRSHERFVFPKSRRLLKRRDFLRVQRRGYRFDLGPIFACVMPNREGQSRIGITTSKNVGNAVVRNRVRRLIRDAARRLLLLHHWPFDVVLIAKRDLSRQLPQQDIDEAILALHHALGTEAKRLTKRRPSRRHRGRSRKKT